MNLKRSIIFVTLLFFAFLKEQQVLAQQEFPYQLTLKKSAMDSLIGVHSFAMGQHGNTILIVGGRRDGLHARQPFNAFPAAQANQQLIVIDLENEHIWTRDLAELPSAIQEQFNATNINFIQDHDTLLLIGGYGFSNTSGGYITYPKVTACVLSTVIQHIQNNMLISNDFVQITDNTAAVTGGEIGQIGDTLYLVGGHRFDGQYNPMGNPTYTQAYTNAIQPFTYELTNGVLQMNWLTPTVDVAQFHRRDYNLVSKMNPSGSRELMISSGVFQVGVDLPFLYPIFIQPNAFIPRTDFSQRLSHYHAANTSLYDPTRKSNHWLFFGGMAQYYYNGTNLVQDNSVPFVKTISRVTLDSTGTLSEHVFPIEMESYLGAGAEFIPDLSINWEHELLQLSEINTDSMRIGWIYGGIKSTAINPFTNNQTSTATSASGNLYEVWLTQSALSIGDLVTPWNEQLKVNLFPNPAQEVVNVQLLLEATHQVELVVVDRSGKWITDVSLGTMEAGLHNYSLSLKPEWKGKYFKIGVRLDGTVRMVQGLMVE